MKIRIPFVTLCLMLILALFLATSAQAGRQRLLYLDWRQVVPSGTGDPNMFGSATIEVNPGQGRLCYSLDVFIYAGGWPPTGATIHRAPTGQNGPLVVDLDPGYTPVSDPYASGCVSIAKDLAHDIQESPTSYYLLVTDGTYPEGAARAQLAK
jgi:hypothetical protein